MGDEVMSRVPGPASEANRDEALAIARCYTEMQWLPGPQHVRHERGSDGIFIHTPDVGLSKHGIADGWWRPGVPATGMPYQWGGFDTPQSFQEGLDEGLAGGDISRPEKSRLGDEGTSLEATGIDCSGYVSRCWRLGRSTSTRELPALTTELGSFSDLRPADILLNHRHVLLFAGWAVSEKVVEVFHSGRRPIWGTCRRTDPLQSLIEEGYRPRRYVAMKE